MDGEDPAPGEDRETHPLNPAATRREGRYWNEHILPVMEWEAPEHRVVLPWDLQQVLGPDVPPVLRWARRKHANVARKHIRDMEIIAQLSRYLDGWVYLGTEPGSILQRVLFPDELGRWSATTIGQDETGSFNVITVFGGSDKRFLENRLCHLESVVSNEK